MSKSQRTPWFYFIAELSMLGFCRWLRGALRAWTSVAPLRKLSRVLFPSTWSSCLWTSRTPRSYQIYASLNSANPLWFPIFHSPTRTVLKPTFESLTVLHIASRIFKLNISVYVMYVGIIYNSPKYKLISILRLPIFQRNEQRKDARADNNFSSPRY